MVTVLRRRLLELWSLLLLLLLHLLRGSLLSESSIPCYIDIISTWDHLKDISSKVLQSHLGLGLEVRNDEVFDDGIVMVS